MSDLNFRPSRFASRSLCDYDLGLAKFRLPCIASSKLYRLHEGRFHFWEISCLTLLVFAECAQICLDLGHSKCKSNVLKKLFRISPRSTGSTKGYGGFSNGHLGVQIYILTRLFLGKNEDRTLSRAVKIELSVSVKMKLTPQPLTYKLISLPLLQPCLLLQNSGRYLYPCLKRHLGRGPVSCVNCVAGKTPRLKQES